MFSLYSKYKLFSSPASRFARLFARPSHPNRYLDVLHLAPRMSARTQWAYRQFRRPSRGLFYFLKEAANLLINLVITTI